MFCMLTVLLQRQRVCQPAASYCFSTGAHDQAVRYWGLAKHSTGDLFAYSKKRMALQISLCVSFQQL